MLGVAATALAVAAATGVEAHASLARAEPPEDAKLAQAPTELRLYFTQGLTRRGSYVQLKDASEREVPVQVAFDDADPKLMKATLPALTPGVYTVKWQSLSADDDDYDDGSYKLTILNPDGSSPDSGGARESEDSGGSASTFIVVLVAAGVSGVGAGMVMALRRRAAGS